MQQQFIYVLDRLASVLGMFPTNFESHAVKKGKKKTGTLRENKS